MKTVTILAAVTLYGTALAQSSVLGGLENAPQMNAPQGKNLMGLKPCMAPLGSGDTPAAKAAIDKANKEIQAAFAKYNVSLPACTKDSKAILMWDITPFRPVVTGAVGAGAVVVPYTFGTYVAVIDKNYPALTVVWRDTMTNTVSKDSFLNNFAAISTRSMSYENFAKAYAANR